VLRRGRRPPSRTSAAIRRRLQPGPEQCPCRDAAPSSCRGDLESQIGNGDADSINFLCSCWRERDDCGVVGRRCNEATETEVLREIMPMEGYDGLVRMRDARHWTVQCTSSCKAQAMQRVPAPISLDFSGGTSRTSMYQPTGAGRASRPGTTSMSGAIIRTGTMATTEADRMKPGRRRYQRLECGCRKCLPPATVSRTMRWRVGLEESDECGSMQ